MGKPATELLPPCTELIPRLLSHLETLLLVAPEHVIKLASGLSVYDDCIFLKITLQTAGIQIGAAHSAVLTVDHHNLGMVEAWLVKPDSGTALHQFMSLVEGTVGC